MSLTEAQVFEQLSRARTFHDKTTDAQHAIVEMLLILQDFGVPLVGVTARGIEQMAMAVIAVSGVGLPADWSSVQTILDGRSLKTRDIIDYVNETFGESTSKGSYDDVRRKHLKLPRLAGIVVSTHPSSNRNNPTRGYSLDADHGHLVRRFGTPSWPTEIAEFMKNRNRLADVLSGERAVPMVPIRFPSGVTLQFGPGEHNVLQKAVVEEFLPRFGFGADVLYVGDAEHRTRHIERKYLASLNFFELDQGELPDVVAYSPARGWLYLIEAVFSSGPISPERLYVLKELTRDCKAEIIYVTAFLDRVTFRQNVAEIAWETEVWIAENPDHLIHFNGDKFLGPYQVRT